MDLKDKVGEEIMDKLGKQTTALFDAGMELSLEISGKAQTTEAEQKFLAAFVRLNLSMMVHTAGLMKL